MSPNRHLQRHRLHKEYRKITVEEIVKLEKRQDSKNGWDLFTEGVRSALDDINPFAPKTTETPTPTPKNPPPKPTPPANDTENDEDKPAPKPPAGPAPSTSPKANSSATSKAPSTSNTAPSRASVGLPASVVPTETSAPLAETTLAVATNTPPLPSATPETTTSIAPVQSSAAASANSNSNKSADEDASGTAAKAGIAFGVVGGVLILFLIVWFIIRKRKQQMERQRLDDERFGDEKFNREFATESAAHAVPAAAAVASDRPRTANSADDKPPPVFPKNTENAWERPTTGNSAHPSNPFGNHAETIDRPVSPLSDIGVASTTPVSPVQNHSVPAAAAAGATVAGAALGTGAVGALARKASLRKDLPRPPDLTLANPQEAANAVGSEQPSGATSPGAAAIVAAGGPVGSAVYRVQLDFQPTMEDELELKAGGLVRLLFEYDDGWALCIRLDRSKQGVVPRTCLSARPVKPRAGPGPHPNGPMNNRGPGQMGPQHPQPQPIVRGPGSIERKPVPGQAY